MIRLARERRSMWAVAVCTLVAAVVAAGPTVAGAVTDRADHATRLSACVGEAVVGRFVDVSAGHVFGEAISCIAYYEVTRGTGDGTGFSPGRDVTRAEMAVFVARAAEVAGVSLSGGDGGFDDIGETWPEARDAINALAAGGIIAAGGSFRPDDAITRAEMATFLVGLLAAATGKVSVDSGGRVLLGEGSTAAVADDYFADARAAVADPAVRSAISALYELGITKGVGATPLSGDDQPGLDLLYSPDGTVTRGQMAAFITRALAHTGLRPRGVTAQYDGAQVVVSVRDASLRPVAGAPVDVFWAPADAAGRVFAGDAACGRGATRADQSTDLCVIDVTDPATGSGGDVTVSVTGLRRVPPGGAAVWAWTGEVYDTVGRGTELYRLDIAEGADSGVASETLVTTAFNASRARFGSSVAYTVQLRDVVGDVTHGVDGASPAQWRLSVRLSGAAGLEDPETRTLVSDNSGEASFTIRVPDPDPASVGQQVTAAYTLSAAGNAPPDRATVAADGGPAATGTAVFSDAPSSIAQAAVTIDTRGYVYVAGDRSNAVTVTVVDQYGDPMPGARVALGTDLSASSSLEDLKGQEFTVDSRGSHRFVYRYTGQTGAKETLTPSYGLDRADRTAAAATVYWAVDAGRSGRGDVVAGDARLSRVVVDAAADGVVMLVYDGNDRFNVRGAPATLSDFAAELVAVIGRGGSVSLAWSRYQAGRHDPVTEYSLG